MDAVVILASLSLALSSSTSDFDGESGGEDLEAAAEETVSPVLGIRFVFFCPPSLKTSAVLLLFIRFHPVTAEDTIAFGGSSSSSAFPREPRSFVNRIGLLTLRFGRVVLSAVCILHLP